MDLLKHLVVANTTLRKKSSIAIPFLQLVQITLNLLYVRKEESAHKEVFLDAGAVRYNRSC